MINTDTDTH